MIPTPICDFVRSYADSRPVRLHMPGHKGQAVLGAEALDITEIDGADNLFAPVGIIAESERNASALFGCPTYYSAEGSSLAIRAMLYLARMHSGKTAVLAGRSAHKTLIHTAALLDLTVDWLYPHGDDVYPRCTVTADDVDAALGKGSYACVFLTDPDYLGCRTDIASVADVCRKHGVLLAVDSAHGAYLHFLTPCAHPMDLGADLCCASAHKTLPVLTGGAYLHVRKDLNTVPALIRDALGLFGSTSPSYLVLQSLDLCNRTLESFSETLQGFLPQMAHLRGTLAAAGWQMLGEEPLKITLRTQCSGYTGNALAGILAQANIRCEYHDRMHLTLMCTPCNTADDLLKARDVLLALPQLSPLEENAPHVEPPRRVLTPRQAVLAPRETLPTAQCVGRILASAAVTCPPAVPIVQCGEEIGADAAEAMEYFGIRTCSVVI